MTDMRKHLLLLLLTCFLVYGNTLGNGFVWDDHPLVDNNIFLSSWRNIPKLFTTNLFAGGSSPSAFYRPVQALTYMVEYHLWGSKPFGYHLTNLLLHLANAMLLYALLVPVTTRLVAVISGLLFIVHPLNTEAVTYISGRADPLAVGFLLLALLAYREAKAKPQWGRYRLASLGAFTLAILSKESAMIFPALLVLYDLTTDPLTRPRELLARIGPRYAPYLAILGLYAGLRTLIPDLHQVAGGGPTITLGQRLLLVFRVFAEYLGLLVLPRDLHMERTVPLPISFFDPMVMAGAFALLLLIGLAWWAWSRVRPLTLGIGWYLLAFLPFSNLVPLNAYIAEHWMYLPAIGLFVVVGLGIGALQARGLQRSTAVPLVLALVLYAGVSIRRNRDWRDEATFYETTLKSSPDSWRVLANLADLYRERGEFEKAIQTFRNVQAMSPLHPQGYLGLGMVYQKVGRDEEAVKQFEMALATYPRSARAHLHLADSYMKMGAQDKAIEHYQFVPELKPQSPVAYLTLGHGYLKARKYAEAVGAFQKGLEVAPLNSLLRGSLGWAYAAIGEDEKARQEYERALKIEPRSAIVRNNLASHYLKSGQWRLAAEQLEEAVRVDPDYAEAHANLGIAYYWMGRAREAEAQLRKALALKPDSEDIKKNLETVTRSAATPEYSLAELEGAVKAQPASARARFNLGSAYGNRGDLEKASREFREALRLDPRNPLIHYALGLLHYQKGERGQAQRAWERAVELDPGFAQARGRLAELKASSPPAGRTR